MFCCLLLCITKSCLRERFVLIWNLVKDSTLSKSVKYSAMTLKIFCCVGARSLSLIEKIFHEMTKYFADFDNVESLVRSRLPHEQGLVTNNNNNKQTSILFLRRVLSILLKTQTNMWRVGMPRWGNSQILQISWIFQEHLNKR